MTVVPDGKAMGIIPIHFNVAEHHLPIREFVETATAASTIVGCLNEKIFDGRLAYEVVVLPPRPGTFLSELGVFIVGGVGAGWAILGSDIGKSFIRGLTGNEPAHHAERLGVTLKTYLKDGFAEDKKKAARLLSEVICRSTYGFLCGDSDRMRSKGITKSDFRAAYKARNGFYQTCYKNKAIRGIGFDETENFPITRNDFPRFIIDLPDSTDDEVAHKWEVEILHLQVTSPNWDRCDSQRHWKAAVPDEKHVTFVVDDDFFWHLVKERQIPTQVRDALKVQWAFVRDLGRRKHTRVIKVLEINGRRLADPLSDEELAAVLGKFTQAQPSEPDLFG